MFKKNKNFYDLENKIEISEEEGLLKNRISKNVSVETILILKVALDVFKANHILDMIKILNLVTSTENNKLSLAAALNKLVSEDTLNLLKEYDAKGYNTGAKIMELANDEKEVGKINGLVDAIKSETFINFKNYFESLSPNERGIIDEFAAKTDIATAGINLNMTNFLKKAPTDYKCLMGMAAYLGGIIQALTKELAKEKDVEEQNFSSINVIRKH